MKRNQSTALVRLLSSSLQLSLALGAVGVFASGSFAANTSKDTYYVNDHLATTVATSDAAGEIAQIESDAFGTQAGVVAKDSRFTGKPYDADMGAYVFPFRNYRSDEARWISADPSGFPDGVNGVAYMAVPGLSLDATGLDIIVINNSSAVAGAGHSGSIVGSGSSWTYNSYGSGPSGMGSSGSDGANLTQVTFNSQSDAMQYAGSHGYDRSLTYTTTAAQDAAAQQAANSWADSNYNVFDNNCILCVNAQLGAANIDHGASFIPNVNFTQSNQIGNAIAGTIQHRE